MFKKLLCFFMLLGFVYLAHAQVSFNRGVNLTGWFQAGSTNQLQFTKYTKNDLAHIKELGCDVIRLPINLHYMTNGSPNYTIDPLFYYFMDKVVDWAEELQIYLILDNHTFDPAINTDPNVGTILNKVWAQMAQHYKDRSDYILYEILNEPHGLTTSQWGTIQQNAINTIRQYDTKHTIVVGASGFNAYTEMKNLPVYTDSKLIYTFHFYDPFIFTHQGASWSSPSMEPLAGVPFPYNSATMPACPASLKGSWVESSLNTYGTDGTVAKVKQLIDIAVSFKNTRNVKIYCGEFGVYIPNCNNADRVYWYEQTRKYLEEKGIPWTTWDYQNGFGLFKKGSAELFDNDLNTDLLQSLGLNLPPQKPLVIKADSVSFPVYRDYVEAQINSSGTGTFDFYNTSLPNNDSYCLYWPDAPQYGSIAFDFLPNKDLSRLVNEGYALDFLIRGNNSSIKFDIRFIDTKTSDPLDHPWRMKTTIQNSVLGDKAWHHMHIPLSTFTEQGSWDNNTWYNPEGKFDWKSVDKMEIVSEQEAMTGKKVWFDNIYITNMDTAQVWETSIINGLKNLNSGTRIDIFPNPVSEKVYISLNLEQNSRVKIAVFNVTGQKVTEICDKAMTSGPGMVNWDLPERSVPGGIYILQVNINGVTSSYKLVAGK